MVKLCLECRKWHIEHMYLKKNTGGMPPDLPWQACMPSAHLWARILRARSKPNDFLNQKVGKYEVEM